MDRVLSGLVKAQGTRDRPALTADSVTASTDRASVTDQQEAWAGDKALTVYRLTERCQIIVGLLSDHGLTDRGPGARVRGSRTFDQVD